MGLGRRESCADSACGKVPAPWLRSILLSLCPALNDAQKLQSRRGPGPGFSEMDDVICEQIQRLGLLYPGDNPSCFVLGREEKGGCKAQKVPGWLREVHQTRMALLIPTPPGMTQPPAKATPETHLVFETQPPPSSI